MSERISVRATGDHGYGVTVTEGTTTTHHEVVVDEELRDILGPVGVDEERLVHESFAYLLDREPATSIQREFELSVIRLHFDDYLDEIRIRLGV